VLVRSHEVGVMDPLWTPCDRSTHVDSSTVDPGADRVKHATAQRHVRTGAHGMDQAP